MRPFCSKRSSVTRPRRLGSELGASAPYSSGPVSKSRVNAYVALRPAELERHARLTPRGPTVAHQAWGGRRFGVRISDGSPPESLRLRPDATVRREQDLLLREIAVGLVVGYQPPPDGEVNDLDLRAIGASTVATTHPHVHAGLPSD